MPQDLETTETPSEDSPSNGQTDGGKQDRAQISAFTIHELHGVMGATSSTMWKEPTT